MRRAADEEGGIAPSVRTYAGRRGEDIAEAMGADAKTIRLPMKKLIADGQIRTKGERRGMRYYAQGASAS